MNGRGGVEVCWGGGRRARACAGRVWGVSVGVCGSCAGCEWKREWGRAWGVRGGQ